MIATTATAASATAMTTTMATTATKLMTTAMAVTPPRVNSQISELPFESSKSLCVS